MISRGHFIGEIVDELATLTEQVEIRNRLGITDLSVFSEVFVAELLNAVLGCRLSTLNEDRPNTPGLDLGDAGGLFGIQVTAKADSGKVRHTLTTLTPEQAHAYDRIVVFCLGKKQGYYSVEGPFANGVTFDTEKDVWDFTEVARMIMALELDKLQAVHKVVRDNTARLRVELEIPDETGHYKTNGYDQWEARPAMQCGDGAAFISHYEAEFCALDDAAKVVASKSIRTLASKLRRIPRISREFLSMLIERRESRAPRRKGREYSIHVEYLKVEREFHGNLKQELDLLVNEGLIDVDWEDPNESGPPEIFVDLTRCIELRQGLLGFIKSKQLSVRQVIGGADLSAF